MAGARYQEFNDLPASQYQMLRQDIEARGIVNPILVDENDVTIDGHQRRRVCAELSIECPRVVIEGLTEGEKKALAIAVNLFRRQLSGVERSTAVHKLAQLGMSQRRIAAATGVSARTVGRDLSGAANAAPENVDPETGEITATSSSGQSNGKTVDAAGSGDDERGVSPAPSPTPKPAPRVVGKDGKSYPATKPKGDDGMAAMEKVVRGQVPGAAEDIDRKRLRADYSKRLVALGDITKLDPVSLGDVLDANEKSLLVVSLRLVNEWAAQVTEKRALRAVGGTK